MQAPDRKHLNATPGYFLALMQRIGLSQSMVSDRVGISKRRIQYLALGERVTSDARGAKAVEPVTMSYPEQYTLEALAQSLESPEMAELWSEQAYSVLLQVEKHLMHQSELQASELLAAVHVTIADKR